MRFQQWRTEIFPTGGRLFSYNSRYICEIALNQDDQLIYGSMFYLAWTPKEHPHSFQPKVRSDLIPVDFKIKIFQLQFAWIHDSDHVEPLPGYF